MRSAREILKDHFFERVKLRLNKCLSPWESCEEIAIRAHSVQNATVLDLLCRDGHVKGIKPTFNRNGPKSMFTDIGRNLATTFEGFCADHDSRLFAPIDKRPIDTSDREQLLLLAYRSLVRELHACMEGAIKLQITYNERVALGIDSGNQPEPAGILALQRMHLAFEINEAKEKFDHAIKGKDFEAVKSITFTIRHARPCIAVSAYFSPSKDDDAGDARMTLNILPISKSESVVIISSLHEHADRIKTVISPIIESVDEYQKFLLSVLVLTNCENFVVSPDQFDTWSPTKVDRIVSFFVSTLGMDIPTSDPELYLF